MDDELDNFLAHYGKKGMKWGVINDDDASPAQKAKTEAKAADRASKQEAKSASNMAKAQKFHKKAAMSKQTIKELDELGIKSPAMRELYGKAVDRDARLFTIVHGKTPARAVAEVRAAEAKVQKIAEKDAAAKEQGKLSRNQKLAIAGGAVALGAIVAYGAYKYPDIVTRNAKPGEKISTQNFLKRYSKRSDIYMDTKLTKDMFDKLDDDDYVVSAGTKFRRMTAYPDESLDKRLYTTHTDADNDRYQGIYGAALRQRTGTKDLYISEMEVGQSVRSPSHKKRVQALMDVMDKQYEVNGEKYWGKELLGAIPESNDPFGMKTMKILGMENDEVVFQKYNAFARQIVVDSPLQEAYFNRIKEMGYNAIIDENDYKQLSDAPMILLDPKSVVKNRNVTPLTPKMEKEARKRLTEIYE